MAALVAPRQSRGFSLVDMHINSTLKLPSKIDEDIEHQENVLKVKAYFDKYYPIFFQSNARLEAAIKLVAQIEKSTTEDTPSTTESGRKTFHIQYREYAEKVGEFHEFVIQLLKRINSLYPPIRTTEQLTKIQENSILYVETLELDTFQRQRAVGVKPLGSTADALLQQMDANLALFNAYVHPTLESTDPSPSSSSSYSSSSSSPSLSSPEVSASSSSTYSSSSSSSGFESSSVSSSSSTSDGEMIGSQEDRQRWEHYTKLLAEFPTVLGPLGDVSKGEIQIVTDCAKIKEIEDKFNQKVGIIAETKFQIYICDAVIFPDGSTGTYSRILWKQALHGSSGAVALPILPDGRILLTIQFRHPLRKWVAEIPRGNGKPGELVDRIAKRELREETGAIVSEQTLIGSVNADSGLTLPKIPLFQAKVSQWGSTDRDPAEASMNLLALTLEEVERGLLNGYVMAKTKEGPAKQVEFADSFTIAALYLSHLREKYREST